MRSLDKLGMTSFKEQGRAKLLTYEINRNVSGYR
jgi:hypothetical protein